VGHKGPAHKRRAFVAELAPPVAEDACERLACTLAPTGVTEVRTLGSLSYVALEVDARQLNSLLATGWIAAVGLNRSVKVD
jgi:hypothetical protein